MNAFRIIDIVFKAAVVASLAAKAALVTVAINKAASLETIKDETSNPEVQA